MAHTYVIIPRKLCYNYVTQFAKNFAQTHTYTQSYVCIYYSIVYSSSPGWVAVLYKKNWKIVKNFDGSS